MVAKEGKLVELARGRGVETQHTHDNFSGLAV